ncbi:MAG TPA: SapC family protein [Burkholderiales bacterium]|nr:SapC family protein [Burkholderiales bacterium]
MPLLKEHRVALRGEREIPPAFRTLNALPISFAEFTIACRDYPIAFVGANAESVIAMAVLGLEKQQNLFVAAGDAWDASAYLPAYVRRHPFCMTRVTVDGKERAERVACVERSALSRSGEPLFDAKGEPLPAWEARRKLLFEYEADLARSEEMCRELGRLQLLETFTLQAVPNQGPPLAMTGLYRVSEQKLADRAPEELKVLLQKGILARIYAHLVSLANFGRLLDRRATQPRRG